MPMSGFLRGTVFCLLIGVVGLIASYVPLVQRLEEDLGLGLLFKLRGIKEPPRDVVIVSIDRDAAAQLNLSGNPSRWPRVTHARLVEELVRAGAKVVTFDVYFTEPRSLDDDRRFAAAVRKAGNVVLAEPIRARAVVADSSRKATSVDHRIVNVVKPIDDLWQAAAASAPFVLPRLPVKVSKYWTFQTSAGNTPTFPVVALSLYALPVYADFVQLLERVNSEYARTLASDASNLNNAVKSMRQIRALFENESQMARKLIDELDNSYVAARDIRKYRLLRALIHLYGGGNYRYLNFYGPPRTIATVPYHEVFRLGRNPEAHSRFDFRGKAVFVGVSEMLLTEGGDSFYTVFPNSNGVFLSGVEIAATAFANLLEDAVVSPIDAGKNIGVLLGWGFLIGVIACLSSIWGLLFAVPCLSGAYLIAAKWQFASYNTWYPIIVPLVIQNISCLSGAIFWNYMQSHRERQNVRKALAFYVPSEVVNQLAKDILDLKKGDQTVYGVCLFTDAAGYTSVSEAMSASELGEYMRKYFDAAFQPIKRNGGLIVDLKGDSILVLWRGDCSDSDLRRRACNAALEVAEAVRRFNDTHDRFKLPTRIGVNAGQIFLGNIGAGDHYTYGARGDAVNTASRMDSLNKRIGTKIVVSDEVLKGIEGFLTREAGSFHLKGKSVPIIVHELIDRLDRASEAQKKSKAVFANAMEVFRRREWSEARKKFECLARSGNDGLAAFYTRLCKEYEKQPPAESWAGTTTVEDK
jgi:adenylate cyclase